MEKSLPLQTDLPNEVMDALPNLLNDTKSEAAAPAPTSSAAPHTSIFMASPPSLLNKAQARGAKLGAGFATLNSDDFARADSFVHVIERAQLNARAQDAHAQAVADDPEALRAMGFYGVDLDDV